MDAHFVHPETEFIEDALETVMLKREVMADILIAWRMRAHPETEFIEDALETVMLKREVMADILIAWRMKEFEASYERYERQMRRWYNHEDDWPMFDMYYDYRP
jgi:hypothetical protein